MIVPIHRPPAGVAEAVHRALYDVIANRYVIEIEQLDGHVRIGEPHDYGMLNGKALLLFYQTSGYSRTGGLPQWRHLDVASFRTVRTLDDTFRGGRDTETGRHRVWDTLFIRADPS